VKATKRDVHSEQLRAERTQAGNPEAFAELVRMHSPLIFQMSLKMLKNHADAEDNLQTVLCKAYAGIDRFEGRSRISTWLVSIAIHEALMRIRENRPDPLALALQKSESTESMLVEVGDAQPDPESRYMTKELVTKAFAGLPPSLVDLFIRNKSEGWTHRELARDVGITIASVKSRIFRVRERMQKQLRPVS
jgi:RNA polymerase sigma-70 factor (ECF subfamily)